MMEPAKMAPKSTSILGFALLFVVSVHCVDFAHFSYSGSQGPSNWGHLSPNYSACSYGKSQSPVNIIKNQTVENAKLTPLTRNYKPANATLVNYGFSVGILLAGESGSLNAEGKIYELHQLHFHTPSEHQIDGEQYDAELHLVHRADDGSFSVVAILFKEGNSDTFVEKIMDKLKELEKETCSGDQEAHVSLGVLDYKLLRKNTRKYFRYFGSLTTPPCAENVTWNILGKVREISKEQLEALKAPLDGDCKRNDRPLQPLNGRIVELYNELNQ